MSKTIDLRQIFAFVENVEEKYARYPLAMGMSFSENMCFASLLANQHQLFFYTPTYWPQTDVEQLRKVDDLYVISRPSRSLVTSMGHDSSEYGYAISRSIPKTSKGFSVPEAWGTWTDSSNVVFVVQKDLPKRFTATFFLTNIFQENLREPVDFICGSQTIRAMITQAGEYSVSFEQYEPQNSIEIIIPVRTSPKDLGMSPDERKLGLGIRAVRIVDDENNTSVFYDLKAPSN